MDTNEIIFMVVYIVMIILSGITIQHLNDEHRWATSDDAADQILVIFGSLFWPIALIWAIAYPIALLISAKYTALLKKLKEDV